MWMDANGSASCRPPFSSALLGNISDPDERTAMINALVDELQRAVPWQSSERGQGQLSAEVCHMREGKGRTSLNTSLRAFDFALR